MNYDNIRNLIKETYKNTKCTLSNFIWAISHFRILCRYAMIGIKISIIYSVSFSELESYRKNVKEDDRW